MSFKTRLMPLYRRAPPFVRHLAGSAWGRYVNAWRYGPETERLVSEAEERETWSRDQWESHVATALTHQLTQAAAHVPHYRRLWETRKARSEPGEVASLTDWPILRKSTLRSHPELLRRDDANPRRLFPLSTSGTSGTPVTTWRDRPTMRAWYALMETRWRRWYGVTRTSPWAILGGQEVVPVTQERPPYWVWNTAARQLYLSNLHLKRENVRHYAKAMRDHGVTYIIGYTSTLAVLARFALEEGVQLPRLKVALTQAEPITAAQRALVAEAFGCPVRETYGMSEAVTGASECEEGVLHLWPEAGVVEVLEDDSDQPVAPGDVGRLICTGLLNTTMPLIRYEIGDRGAIDWSFETCGCGRTLPRLKSLDGRSVDNLITRDGRRVFEVNPVFYGLPVVESQIVQEDLDLVRITLVPGEGYDHDDAEEIERRLRGRIGDVTVEIVEVDEVPRTAAGKIKAVVSKVVVDDDVTAPERVVARGA